MAARTGTTPRKRTSRSALQADKNAAAAPARHSDDDDDDGVDDEAAAAPLIASPRRAAAVVVASVAANAASPQQSPPHPHAWTLLLALVALLAIAAHSALFHPPRSEQPQQQQDPAKRFACPLATAAERDAARLASARNLTRARPWLLRPVRAAPRDAQDLFSAGLLEAHGFNAAEAAAFADLARRRAGPRDSCALCAWLGAYSLGPTPNVVVDARGSSGAGFPVFGPAEAAQADALAQRALDLALEQQQKEQREHEHEHEQGDAAAASRRHRRRRRASAREERLVRALADRNRGAAALVAEAKGGEPLPEPWRPRQEAYARELASLAADVEKQEEKEEEDEEEGAPADADADAAAVTPADVLALAAEAHLCLTPWDYYYYVNDGDDPGHAQPPRRLLLPSSPDGAAAGGRGISASVPRPGRRLRLRPMAAAAERLLRSALRFDPRHSLALHLLVHLAEAGTPGPRPAQEGRAEDSSSTSTAAAQVAAWRGEPAADALAALRLPQGHLLHMPSHVYVRVGRYRDAVRSNAAARRHDVSAAAAGRCAPAYVPEHNAQLASYAAAAAGMERAALASALGARRLRSVAPDLYVARGTEWTTVPLLRARFGDWRAVLLPEAARAARGGAAAAAAGEGEGEDEDEGGEEDGDFARGPLRPPRPDARARTSAGGFGFSKVVYHFVRLLALAARAEAQGEAAAAGGGGGGADRAAVARELRALRRAARDARALREPITLPGGSPGLYASGNAQLAPIYERIGTARAEMVQAQKPGAAATISRARAALEQAAELERALPYFEPPMLEAPASACLGWLLLERADEPRAAAETFRRELAERHPENPWALGGLAAALERIRERRRSDGGASAASAEDRELADVRRRAERAWRDADPDVRARFFGPAAAGGGSSCPQFSAPWPAAPEGQKD